MTETASLLDADLNVYFDDLGSPMTHEPSRPMQWLSDAAVTLAMVLLAPILIIPVALAFATACLRMQCCDPSHDATGRYRSVRERLARPRSGGRNFRSSSDGLPAFTCSYRWN